MDAREEIKSRLAVEDVVGWYLELKRAGRNLKALSPFTDEKTPSLMISPDKNMWYDFSSNQGGDIFSFVMKIEGFGFREALEFLANKAGVDLSKYGHATGGKELYQKRQRLISCLKLATKYYQVRLTKTKPAMEYVFYKRGINRRTAEEFKLGYAGEGKSDLRDFLLKKGFTDKELKDCGLLNQYGGDLFKGRVMIPLMDPTGEVVGYTGRTIVEASETAKKLGKDNSGPKYLNTPATLLYDKTRHIFGLSQAKQAIRENGFVVIVEGNMDVISSHQAGYKMAVATAGTAMTKQHLQTLGKLTDDIRLAYDGDKAGQAAAERAVEIASSLGLSLLVIDDYHGAKDADELIQKNPKLWEEAIAKAKPAAEWLLTKYAEELDLKSPIGKRKYGEVAGKLLAKIQDPIEKDHYKKLVAQRIGTSTDVLDEKVAKEIAKQPTRISTPRLAEHLKKIDKKSISALQKVLGQLLGLVLVKNLDKLDKDKMEGYNDVKVLLFGGEERYGDWPKEDLSREMEELLQKAKSELKKIKRQQTRNLLDLATNSGNQELANELLLIMNQLTKEQNG